MPGFSGRVPALGKLHSDSASPRRLKRITRYSNYQRLFLCSPFMFLKSELNLSGNIRECQANMNEYFWVAVSGIFLRFVFVKFLNPNFTFLHIYIAPQNFSPPLIFHTVGRGPNFCICQISRGYAHWGLGRKFYSVEAQIDSATKSDERPLIVAGGLTLLFVVPSTSFINLAAQDPGRYGIKAGLDQKLDKNNLPNVKESGGRP